MAFCLCLGSHSSLPGGWGWGPTMYTRTAGRARVAFIHALDSRLWRWRQVSLARSCMIPFSGKWWVGELADGPVRLGSSGVSPSTRRDGASQRLVLWRVHWRWVWGGWLLKAEAALASEGAGPSAGAEGARQDASWQLGGCPNPFVQIEALGMTVWSSLLSSSRCPQARVRAWNCIRVNMIPLGALLVQREDASACISAGSRGSSAGSGRFRALCSRG